MIRESRFRKLQNALAKHEYATFRNKTPALQSDHNSESESAFESSNFINIPVKIAHVSGGALVSENAVIDTGANIMLAIPESYLDSLKRPQEDKPILVTGLTPGEPTLMRRVILNLSINGCMIKTSALVSPNLSRPLLGVHLLDLFNLSIVDGTAILSLRSQNGSQKVKTR